MKKRSYFMAIAVVALLLAACSGRQTEPINEASDLSGKVIGAVTSAAPPEAYTTLLTVYIGGEVKDVLFYNRSSDLIAATLAGKVDGALAMESVADYYTKRNSNLKKIASQQQFPVDVMMFLRAEDTALKNELDRAITTLEENGTLGQLKDTWVTNLPATKEPSGSAMPVTEGARTVYVGVTGDYIPLDYMAADGRPAGFNVALLSEMSELLEINFELVSIESQAKFSALQSGRIDVIFSQTYNQQIASLFSDRVIMTRSYFTDDGACFLVKK
jgi:ABC-type amino acid transport substrate-binding protein